MASSRLRRSSTAHCVITPGRPVCEPTRMRDRVQRRVARDADRGLQLGEASRAGLGRVGREQRRVVLQVRDVRLVRRGSARAELLQREHHLDRIEAARRREPAGQASALSKGRPASRAGSRRRRGGVRSRRRRASPPPPQPPDRCPDGRRSGRDVEVVLASAVDLDDVARPRRRGSARGRSGRPWRRARAPDTARPRARAAARAARATRTA